MKTLSDAQIVMDVLKYTINHGEPYWDLAIPRIERERNCTYVGEFCINQGSGWTVNPVAIFYQEEPPVAGYSNYFGIYFSDHYAYITSGQSAVDTEIIGVVAHNMEVIYSRYRHDYRISTDGTVMIDGGRDYTKTNASKLVRMKIIKDRLTILGPSLTDE